MNNINVSEISDLENVYKSRIFAFNYALNSLSEKEKKEYIQKRLNETPELVIKDLNNIMSTIDEIRIINDCKRALRDIENAINNDQKKGFDIVEIYENYHVVSHISTKDDLVEAIETAKNHMKDVKNGIYLDKQGLTTVQVRENNTILYDVNKSLEKKSSISIRDQITKDCNSFLNSNKTIINNNQGMENNRKQFSNSR